jgi:chromate transporter
VFYGVGAAVIAIIARSAVKLVRMTIGRDWLLGTVFAINAVLTAWTETEVVWVFLLSGVGTMLLKAPPRGGQTAMALGMAPASWWLTGLQGPAEGNTLWNVLWYFMQAGAFVFGSGLAIVPFLYGGVVEEHRWLNERQFLDAVAVAMITPGPVVITVAFIGYLVGGPLGALLAAIGVFLPCYLFTVIPAPYYRTISRNRQIKAFVDGVTAAATGAIAGAVIVLGRRAIVDVATVLIALGTLLLLLRLKKAPEPVLILAAGVVGLALKWQ